MAITDIVFSGEKRLARVGLVQLDASIEETHSSNAEVTSHAIEDGSEISDHIRKLPEEITIVGKITNTPIVLSPTDAKSPIIGSIIPDEDRVEVALSELERAQTEGELMSVFTTLKEYENMALVSISASRNVRSGNVLDCTLTLREVFVANSISIDLPDPVNISNKKKTEKGKQTKGKGTGKQSEKSQSILSKLTGYFGG